MLRSAPFLCALLVACGGGAAKDPVTAEEAATAESRPSEPGESVSGRDREEVATEASEPDETAEPQPVNATETAASPDDVRTVLQLFVNDEELNRALHLDKPGRFPLNLSGGDVPSDVKLMNGNQAVTMVGEPRSEKDPVLVVTKLESEGKSITVRFRYDVEKIRGTARYKRGSFGWELASMRIIER